LVIFDSENAVTTPRHNFLDDVFLTAHRVDGDDGIGQVDLLEQLGNGCDFVGFGVGGDLSQRDALFAGPSTDDVEWPQILAGIVRAAASFAVDGHQAIGTGVVAHDGLGDPILEAALEGFRLEGDEEPADAIA